MAKRFATPEQQGSFEQVLAELNSLGYIGDLLQRNYSFGDWFSDGTPERTADAAAFAQTPVGYDTACFAVVSSNGEQGVELIRKCRALGAPRALEIGTKGEVLHWRVAKEPTDRDMQADIPLDQLRSVFQEHKDEWSPQNVLRIKNLGPVGSRQLDFIDFGLIPAIERHVRERIEPLLKDTLHAASTEYERRHQEKPVPTELFQLVFRALTGKIMHDRGVKGFTSQGMPEVDDFLIRVAAHYQESGQLAAQDKSTRRVVLERLWAGVNLKNISVETLAYVWENLLLTERDREAQSIHATPPSIARYIVHRLPIDSKTGERGLVVEPCCGAGTFLVAAMQRLREELPRSMSAADRHHYFKELLFGFDTEEFGLEVARTSLMLADFPFPNRWKLYSEDVFAPADDAPELDAALRRASVVLCNPPFGAFTPAERRRYGVASVYKPVEILDRVVSRLPLHGMIGFVMPLQVLNGKSYRTIRERVARRFADIEVVSLPDKVFAKAEQETALLIAHGTRESSRPVRVLHKKVDDGAWPAFRDYHVVSSEAVGNTAPEEAAVNLGIVDLQDVWTELANLPRINDVANAIHRGVEWNIPLKDNRDLLISNRARTGYRKGLPSAARGEFSAYICPPTKYLNVEPEYQLYKAFDLPWNLPKVVMSAKRKSRSPWRIAAFADDSGLVCYQTFTCLWPTAGWSPTVIAAILNSPVANAFVAAHEGNRDITNEIVAEIPVPLLSQKTIRFIEQRVAQYIKAVGSGDLFGTRSVDNVADVLREIDTAIVRAYGLPEQQERDLLDYFRGADSERPVSFTWNSYTTTDIDETYSAIQHLLEPPGVGPTESMEYLKRALDEDRLSLRKLFP